MVYRLRYDKNTYSPEKLGRKKNIRGIMHYYIIMCAAQRSLSCGIHFHGVDDDDDDVDDCWNQWRNNIIGMIIYLFIKFVCVRIHTIYRFENIFFLCLLAWPPFCARTKCVLLSFLLLLFRIFSFFLLLHFFFIHDAKISQHKIWRHLHFKNGLYSIKCLAHKRFGHFPFFLFFYQFWLHLRLSFPAKRC